jgi:hypothetical protein
MILQKKYDPPEILHNYTSAAVAHDSRSRQQWARSVGHT